MLMNHDDNDDDDDDDDDYYDDDCNLFLLQVNYQGQSRRRDQGVTALLQSIGQQPPFVEEFLLREDKTLEDFHSFLGKYSEQLDEAVRDFIQERFDEVTQSKEKEPQHQEL